MSTTPVKVSIESEASAPGPSAVVRVLRAAVATAVGPGGAGLVSFTVPIGSRHILLGGAGAGKTALLESIALALPPARGGVELFGEDLAGVRPGDRHRLRRRIGMVFQEPRLIDALSIHDNIALAARAAGRPDGGDGREIDELLAWVGLGGRSDAQASDLTIEGRRRLGLARAMINRPELVIVDEPAGDGGGAGTLRFLADINQAGIALLIATRDEDLAGRVGGEVTRLHGAGPSAPSGRQATAAVPGS